MRDRCAREGRSCAPVLWFFSAASDGPTSERQTQNRMFRQCCSSFKKDSVANNGCAKYFLGLLLR